MSRPGFELILGATIWLLGVGLLESGQDIGDASVRTSFGIAGLLIGHGLWRLRLRLPAKFARVGVALCAVASTAVGLGLAAGTSAGWIAAYSGILFVLPLGLALLGMGLWRGGGLTAWAKWIPVALAAAGVVTYGFHTLARDVWDPPDSVMFILLGSGWLLLGLADLRSRPQTPSAV